MLAVIESSLSLPVVLCDIINQYAQQRSVMRYGDYNSILYIHCGTAYECDDGVIRCSSGCNLMRRLKLPSDIEGCTIVTGLVDLLIVVCDELFIYEILPNYQYKLLNVTNLYLFDISKYHESGFLYYPYTKADSIFAYEDNLIFSYDNTIHIYNFDAKYDLILKCKFYTIGYMVAAYMYIVTKEEDGLCVYNLTGKLLRYIDIYVEDASGFIIDEYGMLRYKNIDCWYKIDLNADVLEEQVIEQPECIKIPYVANDYNYDEINDDEVANEEFNDDEDDEEVADEEF